MRRGNIIAGFLLAPFFIMSVFLTARQPIVRPGDNGAFIIVYVFSCLMWMGSFLYLITKNGAHLQKSAPITFAIRHINVLRAIVFILSVLVALSVAFAPKKPITPTKDAQTRPPSLRL